MSRLAWLLALSLLGIGPSPAAAQSANGSGCNAFGACASASLLFGFAGAHSARGQVDLAAWGSPEWVLTGIFVRGLPYRQGYIQDHNGNPVRFFSAAYGFTPDWPEGASVGSPSLWQETASGDHSFGLGVVGLNGGVAADCANPLLAGLDLWCGMVRMSGDDWRMAYDVADWYEWNGPSAPRFTFEFTHATSGTITHSVTPEPMSVLLLGTGLMGVVAVRRRRRR